MTERVPREPVRTSEAPQPRGILKNAGRRGSASRHLQWDEHNLQENEDERESQTFMKIDEPKTPFVHSASVPPMDEEGFDLNDAVASKEATHANTLANARATERAEELVHMVQSSDVPVDLGVVRERYEAEQAHHAAFSEKRHQHYGNEAAALKRRPPPEEEEEEEEEEEDEA